MTLEGDGCASIVRCWDGYRILIVADNGTEFFSNIAFDTEAEAEESLQKWLRENGIVQATVH